MPATSEARIAANRANALRSSGPKTDAGKERSRRNGLKHGMTGRGVVLAEHDAPEVDRRSSALMAELDPKTTLGVVLVGQLAMLSVRMERGARQEEAALAGRVAHAAEDFDRVRVDRAETLFDEMVMADDPRRLSRELRRSTEGIDRLVAAWTDMRADLSRSMYVGWDRSSLKRAAMLIGMRLVDAEDSRLGALSGAAQGGFARLAPEEGAGLDHQARRRWAADRLVERIDEEVAKLEALRAKLDHEAIEVDRAGAADLALFDPSPEAARARRYEAEARRGFFRALRELRKVEAETAFEVAEEDVAEPEPAPVVEPVASALGSCWEEPATITRGPRPSPIGVAPGLVRPNSAGVSVARGLDGRVLAVGRAGFGAD